MDSEASPSTSQDSKRSGYANNQQERIEALRELIDRQNDSSLNDSQPPASNAARNSSSSSGGKRRVTLIAGIGGMLLITAVTLFAITQGGAFSQHQRSHPLSTNPLFFSPGASARLECPHDAAWSPDGKVIAIIGYEDSCIGSVTDATVIFHYNSAYEYNMLSPAHGILSFFDTNTGRLLTSVQPDALILAHITLPAPVSDLLSNPRLNPGPLLSFNYTHVIWSHDGGRVAITFNGFVPTGTPPVQSTSIAPWPGYQIDGVLILNASGGDAQVLFHRFDPTTPTYTEWDLEQKSALSTQQNLRPTTPFSTITPAARYQWGSAGTLSPVASLSTQNTSVSGAGTTSGGASFALWQPGYVFATAANPPTSAAGWYAFVTDIAAWSPDGRYLLERGTIEALTAVNQSIDSVPGAWQGAPQVLSVPRGIAQIYTSPSLNDADGAGFISTQRPSAVGVPIAWSPVAPRIATYSPSQRHVYIYDSLNGKEIASLQPTINHGWAQVAQTTETSILRWSQDGKRLFLYDPGIGGATIWQQI